MLAESFVRNPSTPAYVLCRPGQDLLSLFTESLAVLPPSMRWEVCFAAYYTVMPPGCYYHWRGILKGTAIQKEILRFPNAVVIDLTAPAAKISESIFTAAARRGVPVELTESEEEEKWPEPEEEVPVEAEEEPYSIKVENDLELPNSMINYFGDQAFDLEEPGLPSREVLAEYRRRKAGRNRIWPGLLWGASVGLLILVALLILVHLGRKNTPPRNILQADVPDSPPLLLQTGQESPPGSAAVSPADSPGNPAPAVPNLSPPAAGKTEPPLALFDRETIEAQKYTHKTIQIPRMPSTRVTFPTPVDGFLTLPACLQKQITLDLQDSTLEAKIPATAGIDYIPFLTCASQEGRRKFKIQVDEDVPMKHAKEWKYFVFEAVDRRSRVVYQCMFRENPVDALGDPDSPERDELILGAPYGIKILTADAGAQTASIVNITKKLPDPIELPYPWSCPFSISLLNPPSRPAVPETLLTITEDRETSRGQRREIGLFREFFQQLDTALAALQEKQAALNQPGSKVTQEEINRERKSLETQIDAARTLGRRLPDAYACFFVLQDAWGLPVRLIRPVFTDDFSEPTSP